MSSVKKAMLPVIAAMGGMAVPALIYAFINGTASKGAIFTDRLTRFIFPLIAIFVFGLNYYLSWVSYLIVGYQFSILVLTISAIVKMYFISAMLLTNIFVFAESCTLLKYDETLRFRFFALPT